MKLKNTDFRIFFIYLLPVFFLPFSTLGAMRSKFYLIGLYAVCELAVSGWQIIRDGKINIPDLNGFRFFISMLFILAPAVIFSQYPGASVIWVVYSTLFAFAVMARTLSPLRTDWEIYRRHIFLSGLIPVLLSILPYFSFGSRSLISTFGNQNFLAGYLVICLSCMSFFAKRYTTYIISAIYILSIFVSGSRNALLSCVVLGALFSLRYLGIKRGIAAGTVIMVLMIGVFAVFSGSAITRNSSIQYRKYLIHISSHRFGDIGHILTGNGPGTYKYTAYHDQISYLDGRSPDTYFTTMRNNISHAHNEFLEFFHESGILFVVLLTGLYIYCIRKSWCMMFGPSYPLFITLVLSVFSFPMHNSAIMFINILAFQHILSGEEKYLRIPFRRKKTISFMIIGICVLLAVRLIGFPLTADIMLHYTEPSAPTYEKDLINTSLIALDRREIYQKSGFLYAHQDELKKAGHILDMASYYGAGPKLTSSRALIQEKKGNSREAIHLYRQAVLGSRRYRFPIERSISLYLKMNDLKGAQDFLRFIYTLEKEPVDLIRLAEIVYSNGNEKNAINIYREILEDKNINDDYYIRGVNFRLYQLTGDRKYFETMDKIDVECYIEKEIKEQGDVF